MIFIAIHLFLYIFFLWSLSHGGAAVEYCDESMVNNSTSQSTKEEYKSKPDSLGFFSQIDQISCYCVRLQKPLSYVEG